jgi:curved DNA-binding protein CbpA
MTPLEILDLQPGATKKDIRKAYLRLALLYHPDKAIDPTQLEELAARFRTVHDAYEKLGGEDKDLVDSEAEFSPAQSAAAAWKEVFIEINHKEFGEEDHNDIGDLETAACHSEDWVKQVEHRLRDNASQDATDEEEMASSYSPRKQRMEPDLESGLKKGWTKSIPALDNWGKRNPVRSKNREMLNGCTSSVLGKRRRKAAKLKESHKRPHNDSEDLESISTISVEQVTTGYMGSERLGITYDEKYCKPNVIERKVQTVEESHEELAWDQFEKQLKNEDAYFSFPGDHDKQEAPSARTKEQSRRIRDTAPIVSMTKPTYNTITKPIEAANYTDPEPAANQQPSSIRDTRPHVAPHDPELKALARCNDCCNKQKPHNTISIDGFVTCGSCGLVLTRAIQEAQLEYSPVKRVAKDETRMIGNE